MSHFATIVREGVANAMASGRLVDPECVSILGEQGDRAIVDGLELMRRLFSSNAFCAQDENCKRAAAVLVVASTGTQDDRRTALTNLQQTLTNLTSSDSDVAGDAVVQMFRQQLHLALDHHR
jgi:hypothetical protein